MHNVRQEVSLIRKIGQVAQSRCKCGFDNSRIFELAAVDIFVCVRFEFVFTCQAVPDELGYFTGKLWVEWHFWVVDGDIMVMGGLAYSLSLSVRPCSKWLAIMA